MTDTDEPIYTESQYNSLTPEEQKIQHEVATHVTGEPITSTDDETLQSTFNILRPCDGCLPDEEIEIGRASCRERV